MPLANTIEIKERKNKLTTFDIDSTLFNNFIIYCKENHLNVYSTLAILASISLSKIIYEQFHEVKMQPLKIDILTSMNLRTQTDKYISPEQLGLCSMFAKTAQVILTEENNIINLSHQVKIDLNKFIEHQGAFKLMDFISSQIDANIESFMKTMQFTDPYINISYLRSNSSNINPDFNSLNISKISGCATTIYSQANPLSLTLSLVEYNNSISCSLVYMDFFWENELINKFINLFLNELQKTVL